MNYKDNNDSIWALFEKQAKRLPLQLAVSDPEHSLNYGKLYEYVLSFSSAFYDEMRHISNNEPIVALIIKNNVSLIVAMLATLRIGAAYLILDTAYPDARILHCIDDARPILVITERTNPCVIPTSTPVLFVEDLWEMKNVGCQIPELSIAPHHLAYVVYTSGTTGKPKGIMIEQFSLLNVLIFFRDLLNITENHSWLSVTSPGFDIFSLEILLPLIVGAHCILFPRDAILDPAALKKTMRLKRPDFMQATPSLLSLLASVHLQQLDNLTLLTGGEALPSVLAENLVYAYKKVIHVYGPSETTIWSTAQEIQMGQTVHLGQPIRHTSLLILDEQLKSVSTNEVGTLYIGGVGLARGYLNQSERTHQQFIWIDGQRYYNTGDLVKCSQANQIEFVGRSDLQIKLNGHRIELTEIESVASSFPNIIQTAVVLDGSQLVLFYAHKKPNTRFSLNDFIQYLQNKLPKVMQPHRFIFLEVFPMSPHHKIDRNALLQYGVENSATPLPENASADSLLAQIKYIWEEVLGISLIKEHDEFATLGGNSIHMVQILSRINKKMGFRLTMRHVMENQSIHKLHLKIKSLGRAL